MKIFLAFVKKEIYHIIRDVRTMIIIFGIPVALLLIFGFVINNDIKNAGIAILDNSKDNHTIKIIHKITASGYFKINVDINSVADIEKAFRTGKIKEVIIFENNFGRNLEREKNATVQIIADASEPNTASLLVNYTSKILNEYLYSLTTNVRPFQINQQVRMLYNPDLKSAFMFVPGTMAIILMLISAMMTSISITREKEFSSMEVLLISPLKPLQIIFGKVTPYLLLSVINIITILTLSYFVFKLPVAGSIVLLLAECVLYIIMALSMGIMISTVANTQQVAMFISMIGLLLPTILLSGFIFPIENMPEILQYLSRIIPARYFIVIIKNIMIKGTGFLYVWKETVILLGFTLFFLFISLKKFRIRLE
jgi:ABC-2 type transport system permease protein